MSVVSLSRPNGGVATSILNSGGGFTVTNPLALTVPTPAPAGLLIVNGAFGAPTNTTVPTPAPAATFTVNSPFGAPTTSTVPTPSAAGSLVIT